MPIPLIIYIGVGIVLIRALGPIKSLIPICSTIMRAVFVAYMKSFEAPVVTLF